MMTTKTRKYLINPFSRFALYFGQITGTLYFYTLEHYLVGFRSKLRGLQQKRSEKFKAWEDQND